MTREYQICQQCILDTDNDPDITFNDKGVCNHCTRFRCRYDAMKQNNNKNLKKIVEAIKKKGRNKEYDCIIGVSGGVDSTYVAYLVKQLGLRPLAIHFDNGWNSELAVSNIEKTLKSLDIDLHTYVVDWEVFKDLQLAFLKASVKNCEIPTDHAIMALLFQEAAKHNIDYLISGGNIATEGILPRSYGYDNRDWKHIKYIHKQFGNRTLKNYPHYNLLQMFYYVFVKKIKYVTILDYVDYNKANSMKIITDELSWRDYGGKHFESIYTRFFQAYILPTKYGLDKRKAHYSSLICAGEISREQALEEIAKPPYADNQQLLDDKEYVIKKLSLSEEEFEAIMAQPIKNHKDYPNNAWLLFDNPPLLEKVKHYVRAK